MIVPRHFRVAMPSFVFVSAFCLAESCSAQQSKLGTIEFPTSGSASAQSHFIRGVLFLHSFEYESAADEFREAQKIDPGFAMAYWGEAMTYTHPVWDEQDTTSARKALARLAPTADGRKAKAPTAREKAYLEAVEILYGDGLKERRDTLYSAAMERVAKAYPTDMEAQAFHALSLLGLNQGVRDVPTYLKAGAIAEEIFRKNPDHPGAAHYVIHAYDDPEHAPRGLSAARAYSKIAPGAAHAQHMTTHIFLAMGMWDDVVTQNEIASGHDHEAWTPNHYTLWLNYAYLQQGRYAEALKMIEMIRRHMGAKSERRMWGMVDMRARYIVDTEKWDAPPSWATDVDQLGADGRALWALVTGLGAAKRGDREGIARALKAMSMARLVRAVDKDPVDDIAELELKALAQLAEGRNDEAVALMRQATAAEDAMPVDFGPPTLLKPAHELLGEILLQIGRPKEAQAEFQRALTLAPKRARALLGLARASAAAGDKVSAPKAYAKLRAIWHQADSSQLALVEGAPGNTVR